MTDGGAQALAAAVAHKPSAAGGGGGDGSPASKYKAASEVGLLPRLHTLGLDGNQGIGDKGLTALACSLLLNSLGSLRSLFVDDSEHPELFYACHVRGVELMTW